MPALQGKREAMIGGIHDDLNFHLGAPVQGGAERQITGTQQLKKAMKGKALSV